MNNSSHKSDLRALLANSWERTNSLGPLSTCVSGLSGGAWRSLLFSRLAALHCQARIPGALWLVHSSPLSTNQEAGPVQGHVWSQLIRISTEKDAISSLSSHDAYTLSKTATYLHQQKTSLVNYTSINLAFPFITVFGNCLVCKCFNNLFCNQSFFL